MNHSNAFSLPDPGRTPDHPYRYLQWLYQVAASPRPSVKIDRPSPKRSASIAPFPISVRCLSECNHYRKCVHGRQCTPDCPEYSPFRCSRRDRSPGACNGCSNWSRCRFNKFRYSPEDAHLDYRSTLVDARRGVNLTVQEAISMASLIAPLLRQGLSPYQILASIRNSTFLRRPSTITSSPVSSAKLPGSPPSTCAVRSAGSFPKEGPGL